MQDLLQRERPGAHPRSPSSRTRPEGVP